MKKRITVFATIVGFVFFFSTITFVHAEQSTTSIEEFDRKNYSEQAETLRVALSTIHKYYVKNKPEKAECMVKMFTPRNEKERGARGYDLVIHELDRDRKKKPAKRRSIERIILEVVNKDCMK